MTSRTDLIRGGIWGLADNQVLELKYGFTFKLNSGIDYNKYLEDKYRSLLSDKYLETNF